MEYEVAQWVSLAFLWLCIIVQVICIVANRKAYKRWKKAYNTATGMIFKHIREYGKHIVVGETDDLCSLCQNSGGDCCVAKGASCVRFLPIEGTNLTNIDGTIETPPDVNLDTFSEMFMNWIDSMGWKACVIFKPYQDENEENVGDDLLTRDEK